MKKCSKCKEEKTLIEFGKNKSKFDGFQDRCKKCRSIKKQEENITLKDGYKICIKCKRELLIESYYFREDIKKYRNVCKECHSFKTEEQKEERRQKRKERYEIEKQDQEKVIKNRERAKLHYYENKEQIKEKQKKRYPKVKLKRQEEYKKNPDKHKEKWKQDRIKNKSKIAARKREKRKNNPSFKLIENVRRRIREILINALGNKTDKSLELLGCSGYELKDHLQNQFKEGMSWENYGYGEGKWVMDHIRPIASFDLNFFEERKKCFNYLNIQPLWWEENLEKKDRIEEKYNNV